MMGAAVVLWTRKFYAALWLSFAVSVPSMAADVMILEFTSAKCNACQSLRPIMQQFAKEGVIIRQVDAQNEANLAQRWQVDRLPTLVVLADGEEADRIMGEANEQQLRSRLSRLVPSIAGASSNLQNNIQATNQRAANSNNTSSAAFDFGNPSGASLTPIASNPAISSPALVDVQPTKQRFQEVSAVAAAPLQTAIINPMDATVRIRVDEGNSYAFGTGTIIDQRGDDVLVITCGHLFRTHAGKSPISIEYFQDGRLVPAQGNVIDYQCEEVDIALVSFKSTGKITVAPVRAASKPLAENETVASFGCDHGKDPSRRDSRITKLNRYLGAPNVEAAGAPVQGRSGGGLFDAQSQLVGVCYAADEELNEGLYSAPQLIYQQLAKYGLSNLYDRPATPGVPAALIASSAIETPVASRAPSSDLTMVSTPTIGEITRSAPLAPSTTYNDGFPDTNTKMARNTGAAQQPISLTPGSSTNLTVIVRTSDGQQQIIDIADAPASLVQALQLQSMPNNAPTAVASRGNSSLR